MWIKDIFTSGYGWHDYESGRGSWRSHGSHGWGGHGRHSGLLAAAAL